MTVYVATIDGTPSLVFAALDYEYALQFAADNFVRAELCALKAPDGTPLLSPDSEIQVQAANATEYAIWEAALTDALHDQVFEDRDDAIQYNCFTFLVEYREPDECS